jgi:hypothetical protein
MPDHFAKAAQAQLGAAIGRGRERDDVLDRIAYMH